MNNMFHIYLLLIVPMTDNMIHDINVNLQRCFPWKSYRFMIDDLKRFTVYISKWKLTFNTAYYTFTTNPDTDKELSINARRRDQYLSYDFDQMKLFYTQNTKSLSE
jgi:hypothetical protein